MNKEQLKRDCKARIEECFKIAEAHFKMTLPRVPVIFENRSTKCAGRAWSKRDWSTGKAVPVKITLSEKIMVLNPIEFLSRTPGHEAAHIIDVAVHGCSSGHGANWKKIMKLIGQPNAERCHSMITPKSSRRSATVYCECQSHNVSQNLFNNVASGMEYKCKKCKFKLKTTPYTMLVVEPAARPLPMPVTQPIAQVKVEVKVNVPRTSRKATGKVTLADAVRAHVRNNPKLSLDAMVALIMDKEGVDIAKARRYAKALM